MRLITLDWLKSTLISVPKTSNPKACNDCRLISLKNHALENILFFVTQNGIYRRDQKSGEQQLGFKKGTVQGKQFLSPGTGAEMS